MTSIFELIINKYELFLLIFVRMTSLFIISPIFSRNNIPNILKVGFALLMSILIVNVIDIRDLNLKNYEIVLVIFKEVIIGLVIGYISYLFFTAMYLAGQVIDMQIGFGMVNVLDPQHNIQVPLTGNFLYILATLVFLTINGHHILINGLISTFYTLPVGSIEIKQILLVDFVNIFSDIFVIGFKLSTPILATIIITDVFLGILAKTMPQMNVFVVGMPLKILLGIAVLILIIPMFIVALQHIFDNMYEEIFHFIKVLQKG